MESLPHLASIIDPLGNVTRYTYDPAGRRIARGATTSYTWDARNRLARIDAPGVAATFQYDAFGRRIGKTVNNESVQYLYDGAQAIAELRGGAVAATLLTGLAIDEVLARYTAQGQRSLLTDALGSVLLATQEDGQVVTAYGYSPYGEVQVLGTEEGNPVQYTGRENDGTGLYYYRARYYDPQLKRFIAEDPIGLAGGSMSLYTYVGGNPVTNIDPSGLLNLTVGAGGAAVAIAAGADYSSGGAYNFETGAINGYTTTGSGAGIDGGQYGLFAGMGVTVGLIKGDASNVGGPFENYTLAMPGTNFSVSIYTSPDGEFQGVGIGYGPGIGFARTNTNTDLYPLRKPQTCTPAR